jgi:hypothetical protein
MSSGSLLAKQANLEVVSDVSHISHNILLETCGWSSSDGVPGVPGWTEELQEVTRPEGTSFSDSEWSTAPDLVAGVSHISGGQAGLVEGLLM